MDRREALRGIAALPAVVCMDETDCADAAQHYEACESEMRNWADGMDLTEVEVQPVVNGRPIGKPIKYRIRLERCD